MIPVCEFLNDRRPGALEDIPTAACGGEQLLGVFFCVDRCINVECFFSRRLLLLFRNGLHDLGFHVLAEEIRLFLVGGGEH